VVWDRHHRELRINFCEMASKGGGLAPNTGWAASVIMHHAIRDVFPRLAHRAERAGKGARGEGLRRVELAQQPTAWSTPVSDPTLRAKLDEVRRLADFGGPLQTTVASANHVTAICAALAALLAPDGAVAEAERWERECGNIQQVLDDPPPHPDTAILDWLTDCCAIGLLDVRSDDDGYAYGFEEITGDKTLYASLRDACRAAMQATRRDGGRRWVR